MKTLCTETRRLNCIKPLRISVRSMSSRLICRQFHSFAFKQSTQNIVRWDSVSKQEKPFSPQSAFFVLHYWLCSLPFFHSMKQYSSLFSICMDFVIIYFQYVPRLVQTEQQLHDSWWVSYSLLMMIVGDFCFLVSYNLMVCIFVLLEISVYPPMHHVKVNLPKSMAKPFSNISFRMQTKPASTSKDTLRIEKERKEENHIQNTGPHMLLP